MSLLNILTCTTFPLNNGFSVERIYLRLIYLHSFFSSLYHLHPTMLSFKQQNNKISPAPFACPPAVQNTGSAAFRSRKYAVKNIPAKKDMKTKVKNAFTHVKNINEVAQFAQLVGMVLILL